MPFGAIASIAAPIIGGLISGDASQSAAQTQSDAARYAADLQNQRYQQTRTDLQPYMQMGPQALSNLEALMGFGPIGGMGGGAISGAIGGTAAPSAAPASATGQMIDPRTGQIYDPSALIDPRSNAPYTAIQLQKLAKHGGLTQGPGGQWGISAPNQPNAFGTVNPNPAFSALQPYQPAPTAAAAPAAQQGMALGGFSRDAMMNALQANPAYQFNLQQGMDAINKASAARGMYYAPSTLQGLGSYAQGMASQEYGNIWNRLFNMAGMGQNAATQTGQFGATAATQAGNLGIQGANAQAAGIMGQGQAYQGMIGGVTGALNNPNTRSWLSSLYGSGVSPAFGGDAGIF